MDINSPDWVPSLNLENLKPSYKSKLLSSAERHQRAKERSRRKLVSVHSSVVINDSGTSEVKLTKSQDETESRANATEIEVTPRTNDLEMLDSSFEDYFLPKIPSNNINEPLSPIWAKPWASKPFVREFATQTDIILDNRSFTSKVNSSSQSNLTFSKIANLEQDCLRMKSQVDELLEKLKINQTNLIDAKFIEKPLFISKLDSSCQSDLTVSTISSFEQDCLRLQSEVYELRDKLNKNTLNEDYFKSDEKRLIYYTGLPNLAVVTATFNLLKTAIELNSNSKLCKFQQFMVIMMHLRLNLDAKDLGYRFDVSQSTISRILDKWLEVMYKKLKRNIRWPEREQLQKTMPAFAKGKKQLSAQEVMTTRKIANVRIHVERAMGLTRNKYAILKSVLPIDYMISNTNDIPRIDKLVTVCCALVNSRDSVVPFD